MPGYVETQAANGVQQNGDAVCPPLPATRNPLPVSRDWELITVDTSKPYVDSRGPLGRGSARFGSIVPGTRTATCRSENGAT